MTEPRRINEAVFQQLVRQLARTEWTWSPAEVGHLVAALGWKVIYENPETGAIAEAGWGVGGDEVEIAYGKNQVNDIIMRLTDTIQTPNVAEREFLRDAYEMASAAASKILGPVLQEDVNGGTNVRWRRIGSTFEVNRLSSTITLSWSNNEFQDYWDELSSELA